VALILGQCRCSTTIRILVYSKFTFQTLELVILVIVDFVSNMVLLNISRLKVQENARNMCKICVKYALNRIYLFIVRFLERNF